MNRLADTLSPYLRQHADNPVDWWPWGDAPFVEARRRDAPVIISIGYATCHWCHVMARESFSDRDVAAVMNERFVSIKVDREEHPEVDSAYMTAAGAFTQGLGWPLTIFATPDGRAFFASTYSPPEPVDGHPSFRQVLDAVWDAWTARRAEVDDTATRLAAALAAAANDVASEAPASVDLGAVVVEMLANEDTRYGGFGGAPKFPVAPVLLALQRIATVRSLPEGVRRDADGLATRTLAAMSASPLRDRVDGGFFRYGTRRDWSEPHYERMLYDNSQLLRAYANTGDEDTAAGIVRFLGQVLQVEGGGFASAQDSESILDGVRNEGGYYLLDAHQRKTVEPPALDAKILTGWNGLAIGALAAAGHRFERTDWIALAERAADRLLALHVSATGLVRSSLAGMPSTAAATLEDYGSLAAGLLELGQLAARDDYTAAGRDLLDRVVTDAGFVVPGGGDPTLRALGRTGSSDPGEGAMPSGASFAARAAVLAYQAFGDERYLRIAERVIGSLGRTIASRPVSMGASLELVAELRGIGA